MKLILVFILLSSFSFSYDLTTLDGYWWKTLTIQEALSFAQGFLLGQHLMGELLIEYGIIDTQEEYKEYIRLHLHNVTDIQLVQEITEYYMSTEDYSKPIVVVIYIRNLWKGKVGRI